MKTQKAADRDEMRAEYKRSDFGEMKRGAFVELARRALEKSANAKLSTDGRITVPKIVRSALSLDAGDVVSFTVRADGTIILEKHPA